MKLTQCNFKGAAVVPPRRAVAGARSCRRRYLALTRSQPAVSACITPFLHILYAQLIPDVITSIMNDVHSFL